MNAQERMARGPVWRLFLSMSLPAIIVTLVMVIYNMADVYFIGRAGDTVQVAALALTGPVYGAIQGLGTLLGSGGCTAAALALGGGDDRALNAVTSFCFWGALTVSAALAVVGALFAPEICTLLGASAATAEYAVRYVRVLSLGTPCVLMAGVLSNVVRAGGSTREAMLGNGLGTVINVALDPLLIEVLGMGVEGAALATVIGNAAGCALLIMHIARKMPGFAFSPRALRGEWRRCLNVIALGLPLAVSTLLSSCAGVLNNGLLARYGDTAVAAMGVSGKASMLAVMIAMGICIGIQPAISFNFGRGDAKRALEISRKTAALAFAVSALLGGACYVARDGFMAAFTSDAAVIELGRAMLAISLTACPLAGAYQACTAFLQATGKASYAIALSVLRQGALYVPCMYIMNGAAGLSGLMYTGVVTDVLAFAIALAMCIGWKRRILRGELGEESTTAAKS